MTPFLIIKLKFNMFFDHILIEMLAKYSIVISTWVQPASPYERKGSSALSSQLARVSLQLSAFSSQPSALSLQLSASTSQPSAFSKKKKGNIKTCRARPNTSSTLPGNDNICYYILEIR